MKSNKGSGERIQRIAPFGTDPNTYETGPIPADTDGNLYYNAVQVVVDPLAGFYLNDAIDSWLVKVAPDGTFSMASYKTLTSPEAPAPNARCQGTFSMDQLLWPLSHASVPSATD